MEAYMQFRHVGVGCLLLLALVAGSAPVTAQEINGTIAGTVRDESGSVMPGVTVTVRNPATGLERVQQSDSTGAFRIPGLPFGTFTLVAALEGFRTATLENIEVQVAQVRTVDVGREGDGHRRRTR
jgi:hypothetical protein